MEWPRVMYVRNLTMQVSYFTDPKNSGALFLYAPSRSPCSGTSEHQEVINLPHPPREAVIRTNATLVGGFSPLGALLLDKTRYAHTEET